MMNVGITVGHTSRCSLVSLSGDSTTLESAAAGVALLAVDLRLVATLPAPPLLLLNDWRAVPNFRHFSEQKFASTNSSAIP